MTHKHVRDLRYPDEKEYVKQIGPKAEKVRENLHLSAGGLAQGEIYVGIENHAMPTIRLQHSGGRLVAAARPSEVS